MTTVRLARTYPELLSRTVTRVCFEKLLAGISEQAPITKLFHVINLQYRRGLHIAGIATFDLRVHVINMPKTFEIFFACFRAKHARKAVVIVCDLPLAIVHLKNTL